MLVIIHFCQLRHWSCIPKFAILDRELCLEWKHLSGYIFSESTNDFAHHFLLRCEIQFLRALSECHARVSIRRSHRWQTEVIDLRRLIQSDQIECWTKYGQNESQILWVVSKVKEEATINFVSLSAQSRTFGVIMLMRPTAAAYLDTQRSSGSLTLSLRGTQAFHWQIAHASLAFGMVNLVHALAFS